MFRKRSLVFSVLVVFVLALLSCARDYVTGKRTFNLMSEAQEIALGREADPQIVAEYGLYDDPKLTAYVDSMGQSIARICHRPGLKYTFRVVDSPVVNAFALPGGWVYFTRGILAHFNSEAEMAGVMGHEIGHIAARHGAEQYSKAQLAQIGLGVGSMLSDEFYKLSGVAQLGVSLLFLKFSRSQESESDRLGVEYSTRLGYNAHDMAGFFNTIGRLSARSGQTIPSFLSTHPNPADREVRVNQLADEWQKKVPYKPKKVDRRDYLRRIDGIIYGDDPRQGFVEKGVFYHPGLRFQFPVPAKWTLVNSPSRVDIVSPEKNAGIQFTLARASSPERAASEFLTNAKATELSRAARSVHGMRAIRVVSNVGTGSKMLQLLSYFIRKDQNVYAFHGYTTPALFPSFTGTFESVMTGFDHLRNRAALNKKPNRVRIERIQNGGDLATVLKRFHMKDDMLEELALLNGMKLTDRVKRGDYIKIVRP